LWTGISKIGVLGAGDLIRAEREFADMEFRGEKLKKEEQC
jgi:hypothetical protein